METKDITPQAHMSQTGTTTGIDNGLAYHMSRSPIQEQSQSSWFGDIGEKLFGLKNAGGSGSIARHQA